MSDSLLTTLVDTRSPVEWSGAPPTTNARSEMNETAVRGELLDQVELIPIGGQH